MSSEMSDHKSQIKTLKKEIRCQLDFKETHENSDQEILHYQKELMNAVEENKKLVSQIEFGN